VYGPSGATLVSGTSHVETGLLPATAYVFQVSALDAAGNESDLSATLVVATGASAPVEFRVRIAGDADDVEENLANAALDLTSSDLELIQTGSKEQLVGMRFLGIPVPAGAHIVQAYVQFTVDETGSDPTSLSLRAERAANAAPFGNGAGLPSARTQTAASAAWNPAAWTSVGAAGAAQRTPDLAGLIQEVVDQPGWSPGNALVLLVSGSGKRVAEAYDGVAAAAPELVLVYEP
jgi:chitodextrinase